MTATPVLKIWWALAGAFLPFVKPIPSIQWMNTFKEVPCFGRSKDLSFNLASPRSSYLRCVNSPVVGRMNCDIRSGLCSPLLPPPHDDCAGVLASDFFTTPQTLCRGYYRCRNGSSEQFTCPHGSFFDINSQICVRTGGFCHELVCSGRVNGRYIDTSHDCRRSFVCEGGALRSLSTCPSGTRFNGNSCQPKEVVQCVSERSAVAIHIPPSDPCSSLPNGFQKYEDESCRDYVLCHSGQTIAKLKCAPGDYFNGVQCAPTKNSSCKSYCDGKPDGIITDLRRQCRGYVNCLRGRELQQFSCPDGSLFNGNRCVPSLLYQCPLHREKSVCSNLKNGYHTDYMSGCTEYFYCYQEKLLLRNACKDGKVWNGNDCVDQSQFFCKGPEPWPGCDNEQGFFADKAQSSRCKFYHYCSEGKRVRLRCQDGLVFDGKNCVSENSFSCPILDTDCFNKQDGYYPDPKSKCRSYFYCSDGRKTTYVCPENQVFDNTHCVPENEFKCMSDTNVCVNKTNGYHADESSGCHYYMYCFHGVLFTSFKCPEGQVFDGKKCIPFEPQICPKPKSSCLDAEDGLYSEINSQCKTYFKCVDKIRTKTFTCREGKVFNGSKCVRYLCPVKSQAFFQRDDCIARIGFFQDFTSKCNKYYFCVNGVKTVLSCKNGEVFNGELCTSKKNYTCPSE